MTNPVEPVGRSECPRRRGQDRPLRVTGSADGAVGSHVESLARGSHGRCVESDDRAMGAGPGPATVAAVSGPQVPGGVVHKLPGDLRTALVANLSALDAWKDITPLARNEFICWVEDAKQDVTRERRIRRTQEELEEGQRRPCCWPGCSHRERNGR